MATSAHESTEQHGDDAHHDDAQAAFIDRVAAKYEKEDAKVAAEEDGVDGGDEEEQEQDAGTEGDDDTEEHPDAGTSSDDSDGSEDESEADSTEGDDDEHPDDEEEDSPADDSEEGAADDDDEAPSDEEGDEEEDGVSDTTKAALKAKGAELTLDDVPKEYRPIIEKKLKGVESAFGRVMQEQTAFRAERAKVQAEEKFRSENPALVIVEMIQAGGDKLFESVNDQLEKLADETQAAAFKIVVKDKRKEASDAITAAEQKDLARDRRAGEVESYAADRAKKLGLPWRYAERAVVLALKDKTGDEPDLTNAEIDAALKEEADAFNREDRERRRAASKDVVKQRTEWRRTAPPAAKRPASAASPRPAPKKTEKIDHNSEESRHAAMMKTARRVMPGVKEK